MKIGLLIYGALNTLSGGYYYDRKLVEYLQAQGDTVEILSLPWRSYPAHLTDNFTFRLPRGLDVLIQDELNHPSLILANQRRAGYPVLSLVHHLRCSEQRPAWQNWFYRQVERAYLNSVDGFIFNSHTTHGVVTSIAPNDKPFVVAHPPTDRFGQPITPKEISVRSQQAGPLKLVFVGNLIHRKGLHTLLAALQQVTAPITLAIIGGTNAEPAYAASMQTLAASLPGHIDITFHGALGDEALAAQLRDAHLLVVPSSYEGFGIVYLEGMAFGLPAIGSSAGAAPEIITGGQDGYLIPPDDSAYLASLLNQLSTDRALLETLSIQALARYQRQPGWPETAGRIRQFILEQIA